MISHQSVSVLGSERPEMPNLDIVIHPSASVCMYREGDDDPPHRWSTEYLRDALRDMLPDIVITLGAQEEFDRGLFSQVRALVAGAATPALIATMPRLEWLQLTESSIDHFFKDSRVDVTGFGKRGMAIFGNPRRRGASVAEHGHDIKYLVEAVANNYRGWLVGQPLTPRPRDDREASADEGRSSIASERPDPRLQY